MEQEKVITEFRIVDEFGNDVRLSKETSVESLENGVDIYFLYQEFVVFLYSAGFHENTISKIQFVDI